MVSTGRVPRLSVDIVQFVSNDLVRRFQLRKGLAGFVLARNILPRRLRFRERGTRCLQLAELLRHHAEIILHARRVGELADATGTE